MEFKLISVDVFQTLVDVPSIEEKAWKIFLGGKYSPIITKKGSDYIGKRILNYFSREVLEKNKFETVKSVYSRFFSEAFQKFDVDFDPNEAATIFAHQHNYAVPYSDTEMFLGFIDDNYTYLISTDADNDMIGGMNYWKNSDKIFTSEDLKCYKMSKTNGFFKSILDYYQVEPKKILHIGDAASDIVNPKSLGIKTCWINRTNTTWQHEIEPDFRFPDLVSILRIL
jgi:putative hydrolase of the HAD superfamily